MSFPIYESIYNEIQRIEIDMNEEDEKFIQEQVKTLDTNGREIFYGLIRKDEIMLQKDVSDISYKQMKHGVRIDFDKLSLQTKKLLYAFLKRHEKNMTESILFT